MVSPSRYRVNKAKKYIFKIEQKKCYRGRSKSLKKVEKTKTTENYFGSRANQFAGSFLHTNKNIYFGYKVLNNY